MDHVVKYEGGSLLNIFMVKVMSLELGRLLSYVTKSPKNICLNMLFSIPESPKDVHFNPYWFLTTGNFFQKSVSK